MMPAYSGICLDRLSPLKYLFKVGPPLTKLSGSAHALTRLELFMLPAIQIRVHKNIIMFPNHAQNLTQKTHDIAYKRPMQRFSMCHNPTHKTHIFHLPQLLMFRNAENVLKLFACWVISYAFCRLLLVFE